MVPERRQCWRQSLVEPSAVFTRRVSGLKSSLNGEFLPILTFALSFFGYGNAGGIALLQTWGWDLGISPLGTTAHSRLEEAGQSIEAYSWPECIVLPTRHLCLGKAEWRPSEVVQVLIPRIWEYLTLYKGTRKICSIKDREMERRSWIMPVSTKICNHNAILIRGDRRIRERCKDGSRGRRRNTVLSALKMEEGAMSQGMQAASRS